MNNNKSISQQLADFAKTVIECGLECEFVDALSDGYNKPIEETIEEFKKEWDV